MIPRSSITLGGKTLSRIILGTHSYGSTLPDDLSFPMMDAYFAAGGNVLDTAAAYGDGASEAAVGRWMKARGCRDQIVLCTKCGNIEFRDGHFVRHRINPAEMRAELERSMTLLETDYVDVYFLHKDDPSVAAGEVIDFFQPYLESGVLRHIGASNWTVKRIAEANDYAAAHGLCGFEFSELAFSLREFGRTGEHHPERMLDVDRTEYAGYMASRMPVFGYNSQAYGYFYKYFDTPEEEIPDTETNRQTLVRLREICRKRGLNVHQALFGAYLGCDIDCFPIVTTTKAAHLTDVLNNCDTVLSPDDARYVLGSRLYGND